MATQITKLELAVQDWKSGMSIEDAAEKNKISKAQLEQAITLALCPMAAEEDSIGDIAAFSRIRGEVKPLASVTLKHEDPAKATTITVLERDGQKMAFAYDSSGRPIDMDTVYKEYGIKSIKIDANGDLTFDATKSFAYTNSDELLTAGPEGFWDKLTSWIKGDKETVGIGKTQYAQVDDTPPASGAPAIDAKQQATANAAFADEVKNVPNDVKAEVAALAKDCQAKLEAGDTEGAEEAQAELAKFLKEHPDLAKGLEVAMQVIPDVPKDAVEGFVVGTAKAVGAVLGVLASCAPDQTQIQNVKVEINQNSSLEDALNALLQKQDVTNSILQSILEREISNGMTLDEIKDLVGGNTYLLKTLIDAMTENNQLLKDIKDSVSGGFENVLAQLVEIKQSVQKLTDLIAQFPQYKDELNEIINGIKTGNMTMAEMKATITQLLQQAVKNGDTQNSILEKLDQIQASNMSDGEKLAAMLQLLGEMKDILHGLADNLNTHFKNDAQVNKYLETIIKNQEGQKEEQTKTNELLQKLYNLVEKLGTKGDSLGKEILRYIATIGFDMNQNFAAVIDAINNGASSIQDMLEKVLANQDKNTKAIIEAMGNIKVGSGGTVDLSSLEAMVAKLLEQAKANGDILSNIDAKTDVIATTTKSILAALEKEFGKNDERYNSIKNILDVIAGSKCDDAKLLAKLDDILAKLDEIKDAIKDHKVTVDVTGKVTCECNCGNDNKHEGILGDINELLQ